jgi:hypothetical protein
MPLPRTIWRIDGITATTAIDDARLADGLRLHVAHSPLTTVAMQIGVRQQCYVVLDGCPGCLTEQCRIGCRVALFRRLLPACIAGVEVRPMSVPQGFARRPYQRGVLARPGPDAQSLDAALLQPWHEARLIMHWTVVRTTVRSSVLLLTSAEDPAPFAQLRAAGWMPLQLPPPFVRRWGQQSVPTALPFGARWNQAVSLLTPAASSAAEQSAERL